MTQRMEMYEFAFKETKDEALNSIKEGMAIVMAEHLHSPPDRVEDNITGCPSCNEVLAWDELCTLLKGLYQAMYPLMVGRLP